MICVSDIQYKWCLLTPLIFLVSIVIGILVIFSPVSGGPGGADGGTDEHIDISANVGGSGGEFSWNSIHNFVIYENDAKMNEEMNITVCEDIKYQYAEEKWKISGYIFVHLEGIRWDDDPEPTITISQEEFEEYSEDGYNLSVMVLGEYYRNNGNDSELRQVYKEVLVQRPNHAPVPVAMITNSDENENGQWDNWTTIDSSDDDEIVYYIDSEGIAVKFYLNASQSLDQDGDIITDVRWDLDGDGEFGAEKLERKMNTTVYLGEGDHILGLIVSDGNKDSDPLYIRIIVKQPIRYPDLTVQNIQVVNKNGLEDILKGDRCAVIAHVKNIGDLEVDQGFDVFFEYWFRDTSPDQPDWIQLGTQRITDTIYINGLKLVEIPWDTGSSEFIPGVYSFRAIVDYEAEIKELRERNNVFPREGEDENAENITLMETCCGGEPDISIVEVMISKTEARVNEIVWINVTVENTGNKRARYVDVLNYINNDLKNNKTIDIILPGENATISFAFSSENKGTYNNTFILKDNGEILGEQASVVITVGSILPNVQIISPENNSQVSDTVILNGTVNFDNDLFSMVSLEISIDGRGWLWVANSTEMKYWQFNLSAHTLGNGTHIILLRAFDGIFYSEEESLILVVSEKSSDKRSGSLPNPLMISGVVVVIGSLGLLGFVYSHESFRFTLYSLFTLPLYSKLHKDEILKDGNRLAIYEFVLSNPGANLSSLFKELRIGYGTLMHHLTVLERYNMIHSRKEFGKRIFVSANQNWRTAIAVNSENLSLIQRRVLDHLRNNGPMARWQIGIELGMIKQTVSYTIQRLEKIGLVHCEGTGKGSLCYATDQGHMKQNS